ncbi:hypothetical protein L9F63_005850, partial [Diploptera punctata]
LDGKFRVFNTQSSQPEAQTSNQQQTQHQQQQIQQEPVKFPITNGSLFTSVDGRLPIIHNYRRGKGMRTGAPHCISMGLPNANARRNEMLQTLITLNSAAIDNSHSDIFKHRSNSTEETQKLNQTFTERPSEFQPYLSERLDTIEKKALTQVNQNSREESTNANVMLTDFGFSNLNLDPQSDGEDEELTEYNVDDDDDDDDEPIYATLSSRSCCSATTAANDDFEFFQHEEKISKHVGIVETNNLTQNIDENHGQSLLYRYQREMRNSGERVSQAFQCADWTVDQNNEVLKLVLPLIESYTSQKGDKQSCHNNKQHVNNSKQRQDAIAQNASEIMKTVIENELKNSRHRLSKGSTKSSSSCEEKHRELSFCSRSEFNDDESCSRSLGGDSITSCESFIYKPHVNNASKKKWNKKQNFLAGSLSLNNLDELLLEEEEEDATVRKRSNRSSPNDKSRNGSQNDPSSSDEREVVFQLPVKSESELSLYRLDLDNKSLPRITVVNNKPVPPKKRIVRKPGHLQHQEVPPSRKLRRQKKLPVPVLSVESLNTALNRAGVSYLDNGDLYRHGSVPDLKRVFVSGYL